MTDETRKRCVDEMLRMGGDFFGQFNDPTEIEATRANYEKISSLHPSTYKFKLAEDGRLMAWTVVLPTSKELANDFVERRITERELLEKTVKMEEYDALYLFAALTVPEYRGRGYAKEMLKDQIREIVGSKRNGFMLFAWTVTEEGKGIADAVSRDLGMDIALRRPAAQH